MLSTPPAFILSQDQTLKKCVHNQKCAKRLEAQNQACLILRLQTILYRADARQRTSHACELHFVILWVQSKFNINLLAYISLFTVLKDLSIVLWMCPSFRTVLSKNFRGLYLCVSLFNYQGSRLCCFLETACLLYHSCLPLSRTFLKFFKTFLKLFCDSQTNISHCMCDVNTYFSFF